jgi:uncharacterized protein (DUF1800 family)
MRDSWLEPWQPRAGEWDRAAAQHLFRRAGFGARPEELERALAEGPAPTLARLSETRTDPELARSVHTLLAAGDVTLLQAWWMGLILAGGAPLRERMTLVWHDHFATSNDKVDDVRLMHAQNELFRSHGLGDFRLLLHAVARDAAMLTWLDGDSNRRGHPNENFARELLELFALGIGNYDERDVQEAARAFSGWGTEGRATVFRPERHDDGEKVLFGQRGRYDADEALDLVLAQPACMSHVARVLLEAFVAPAPEPGWIDALAEELRADEWDIGRTLSTLLSSRLFHSEHARRTRIAGPVELLAVTARCLGARAAPVQLARQASAMGQALFRPPSVKGWDGGRAWIHSGSWIARHNALVALAAASEPREPVLEELLPDLASPELEAGLQRLARAASGEREAREAELALVLTAPEYQLF